jgi:hypothetical protein
MLQHSMTVSQFNQTLVHTAYTIYLKVLLKIYPRPTSSLRPLHQATCQAPFWVCSIYSCISHDTCKLAPSKPHLCGCVCLRVFFPPFCLRVQGRSLIQASCRHCGTSSIATRAQCVAPASQPRHAMQRRDLEMSQHHLCSDPGTIAGPRACLHADIEVIYAARLTISCIQIFGTFRKGRTPPAK